ncbi:hypothetical protein E2C01_047536 [Portunus trituberculatus]|uniref:Uncharacterized protein n=1 Tax=Portunus trituberculatus TaxID=210409 RepID=A0A5B7G959_PORTR|nr:hypothetical protein [Portunus trituberculatus]
MSLHTPALGLFRRLLPIDGYLVTSPNMLRLYSGYFMASIKIPRNDVFHALADLNTWNVYGPDGILPIV